MSEKKPSVAVIVPAYNAAKTIGRTLDSILAQTWGNVQAWVVDDGSRDETVNVVKTYTQKDTRVRLVQQTNQGPYAARLNAIKRIDTDYFGFVDSDDTIDPVMYEKLVLFAEQNNLDVVRCDIAGEEIDHVPEILRGKEDIFSKFIVPKLFEGKGNALITDKIYRITCREMNFIPLRSIAFEDVIMNMQFFQKIDSFGYLHEGFYHYFPNPSSTTRTFRTSDIDGFVEVLKARAQLIPHLGGSSDDLPALRWIIKNVGNMLNRVSYAKRISIKDRYYSIVRLVTLPIIESAIKACATDDDIKDRTRAISWASKAPCLYYVYISLMSCLYGCYGSIRQLVGRK